MRALLALLLLAQLGCVTGHIYSQAPKICSRKNVWAYRVDVFLEDDQGHSEYVGWVEPGERKCTGWDLPGSRGRFAYVLLDAKGEPTDIRRDPYFQAWALMTRTPDY
jgi:hypothetical protein